MPQWDLGKLQIYAEVERHGDRTFTRLTFSISSTNSFCGGPAQWPEPVWSEVQAALEKFRLATEIVDPDKVEE